MDHRIVRKKLELLHNLAVASCLPIEGWTARTADNPSAGHYAYDSDWTPTPLPASCKIGKTVFLKAKVTVPESLPLGDTYLTFSQQSLEGLLRVDGAAYAGIDDNHPRVLVPRAGALDLELEFHSVPSALHTPPHPTTSGFFVCGEVQVINRDVEALIYDVNMAFGTAIIVTDERRKVLLERAVEDSLLAVDLTLPREELLEEVANARRILAEQVNAIASDPEAGSLYAVGHSHIDTAWLWPLKETVRKCGRTFSTACRLMETYPDFYFACSQPQLYQYTKDYYPEIYAQIKKWVATGRWDTAGAMWIEADCNVTSGESLVRQILLGLKFFQEEFGTTTRVCWLPDVFGYPSSLPEILKGCGLEFFYTYKLHWQAKNAFPDHLFRWRGLDGSEILATVVNDYGGYNCNPAPEDLYRSWQHFAQKAEYPEIIFPYGFGDGGGGVTETMMEMRLRAQKPFPGLPSVRTGTVEGFFEDVIERGAQLPVWDGELYVETHRGTYTTQSELKKANRKNELLLRDAEIWNSLANGQFSQNEEVTIKHAWHLLLLNQFHDILPGSSIPMVYVDAHNDEAAIRNTVTPLVESALGQLSGTPGTNNVRVFNSLSWDRQDAIVFAVPKSSTPAFVVKDDQGQIFPVQIVERSSDIDTVLVEGAIVPSIGYADFSIEPAAATESSPITITTSALETPLYKIALNKDGAITSLFDKVNNREVVAEGFVANDLQVLQDGPEQEDAWNIHETVGKRRYPIDDSTTITVVETGPVRGIVRVHRTHRETTIEQDIVVTAASPRIDFVTRVTWNERHTALKVAFPVNIRSLRATYEVQFGAIERPTHRNTSWDEQKFEVPAHRWADLSESGYGVSLLNDCRYGYSAEGNILRLTLLRSTTWPDPLADKGDHEFTYSLLPHAGNWVEGETPRRAWELNVPMVTRSVAAAERPKSFITLSTAHAIVEALKPAEDGRGLILRLYEPHGGREEVTVTFDQPVKQVTETNHVETDGSALPVKNNSFTFQIKPFQIKTFRVL